MNISDNQHPLRTKENGFIIALSLAMLIFALAFNEPLYGVFGEENYLMIHFILEVLIITISFTIATHSWVAFPRTRSRYRLWMGALFFSLGIIEVAHVITYKGMPYFFSESSAYKATWFFMVSRLTQVAGLIILFTVKDRILASQKRWMTYSIAAIYALFWVFVVFYPVQLLPELVKEGVGTTALKNNLQYIGMLLEVIFIGLVGRRFKANKTFNLFLILASSNLLIGDYFYTSYKDVYDINNFIGHLFQLTGFLLLQRAIYYTSIEEPFLKQQKAERQLKQSEKFLQTITTQMGEGLIVTDANGKITLMNLEAEHLLQWSREELVGKNVHTAIHRIEDGQQYPLEQCPNLQSLKAGKVYRTREDWFIQKNGVLFPVSYVSTPLFEGDKLTGSIMVFRDITQQVKDQELIQYMAFHDELTKLPNLRFLIQKLTTTIEKQPQEKAVIIVLDIDRFKDINEALGHSFGDSILRTFAERLQSQLPPQMFLGRLSGDEFVIILTSPVDEAELLSSVEHIRNIFNDPLDVEKILLKVNTTMGISIYPDDGKTAEKLLQHANMALVEAQGLNKFFQFYQPSMDGKAYDRLVLENDLYSALSENQLYLVYQPQVNIETGKVIGVEALLRWHHPNHGPISPAKFIPIAEKTGLIVPIGEWVLRTACRQMKQWHDLGYTDLVMAVNLSIRQFYQQNLVEMVTETLRETGLPAKYLEVEITESMMMNMGHTMKTMDSLRNLGITIAIDDFGTGYSSLAYLKNLPVNRLKIDQSFIRDLLTNEDNTTIVSTIVLLARNLKLDVIAEGVETTYQTEVLQRQCCQQVQGYLFSPPLTANELIRQFETIQQKAREAVFTINN